MQPEQVNLGIAFLAGVLSLLSPCVLALLPAYAAYISGISLVPPGSPEPGAGTGGGSALMKKTRVLIAAAMFVAGFGLVFTLFGASASLAGQVLLRYQPVLRRASGVVVILFGLHALGGQRTPLVAKWALFERISLYLAKLARPSTGAPATGVGTQGGALRIGQPFVLGLAMALGWSPCVGPLLGTILFLSGTSSTLLTGVGLLLSYAAGMALPFLLLAVFIDRARRPLLILRRGGNLLSVVTGLLLVGIGVMLYTNSFLRLASYFNYFQIFP